METRIKGKGWWEGSNDKKEDDFEDGSGGGEKSTSNKTPPENVRDGGQLAPDRWPPVQRSHGVDEEQKWVTSGP